MEQIITTPATSLELKPNSIASLNEIRKWTMFFSILGFIFIFFIVVVGIAAGTLLSSMAGLPNIGVGGVVVGFFYLVFGAIMFFPMLFLYRFSRNTKKGIAENDSEKIGTGLLYLKRYFRFIGILAIIFISFYLIIFLAMMLGGFAGMMFSKDF
jgi:hypothetical protein